MPHAGPVPSKPGQYILAGFNGHGMPQIYLTAKGIAKMIREGAPFGASGIPRIFETTRERLASKENALLDGNMRKQGYKDQVPLETEAKEPLAEY